MTWMRQTKGEREDSCAGGHLEVRRNLGGMDIDEGHLTEDSMKMKPDRSRMRTFGQCLPFKTGQTQILIDAHGSWEMYS